MNRTDLEISALQTRIKALEAGRSALIEENTHLNALVKKDRRAGEFYLRMQQTIMADENIRDSWNEFYTFLCLAAPDINALNKEPD